MFKIAAYHWVLVLSLLFMGCTKNSDEAPTNQENSLVGIFDSFYTAMAERYVFWDIDTTNWNQRTVYRQQFAELDINIAADRLAATELFRTMTASLIDHHYTISFQADGITGVSINPARERKIRQGLLQSTNSYPNVIALLQQPYYDVTFGDNTRFLTGKLNAQTLLLKVNRFQFVRNQGNSTVNTALQWFLQEANNPLITTVVLDLRSCVGGDLVDLDLILGALVRSDITFGYTKYKQGRAPLDYGPIIPAILRTSRTDNTSVPQVMVLTDSQTASLAELVAYIVKDRGLGQVIGQNTYGAFSPISDTGIFYSGDLVIGNFMTARTSSVQFLGTQMESLEGIGVLPTRVTNDALGELRNILP